jgi:hypothetical protein
MRIALALILSLPASAATLYVDDDSKASNPAGGTVGDAFRSLADAAMASRNGDTILVLEGRYDDDDYINVHWNVTIEGVGADRTLVTGQIRTHGVTATIRDVGFYDGGSLYVSGGAIDVDDCVFSGTQNGLAYVSYMGGSLDVRRSTFESPVAGWGAGIRWSSYSDAVIDVRDSLFVDLDTGVSGSNPDDLNLWNNDFVNLDTGVDTFVSQSRSRIRIRLNDFDGVHTAMALASTVVGPQAASVRRNIVKDAETALSAELADVTLVSNALEGEVVLTDTDSIVAHNTVLGDAHCVSDRLTDESTWVNNAIGGDFVGSTHCEASLEGNVLSGDIVGGTGATASNRIHTALGLGWGYRPMRGSALQNSAVSTSLGGLAKDLYGVARDSSPNVGAAENASTVK